EALAPIYAGLARLMVSWSRGRREPPVSVKMDQRKEAGWTPAFPHPRRAVARARFEAQGFGDVQVGLIGPRAGVPSSAPQWGWSCGFFPAASLAITAAGLPRHSTRRAPASRRHGRSCRQRGPRPTTRLGAASATG